MPTSPSTSCVESTLHRLPIADNQCPLSGVKRTFLQLASMSVIDPKRTSDASFGFRRHSTDLRIAGSHSHLSRIDGENLQPGGLPRCMSVQDTAASGGIS